MSEQNPIEVKKNLILGDEFENALISAAEVKNNNISLCKERNKHNYSSYFDIMLGSRVDVQEAMSKKGKNKTDADKELVKNFKKSTSQTYSQVCDLIQTEELEEGEESKIEKLCKKIISTVKMMNYIGHTEIEDEFKKYGITLNFKHIEEENDMFAQDHIKETIKNVYEQGKTIKEDINKNNEDIKTNIYESSVPIDLQYDKSANPTGIKSSDFCKLVDIKAKLLKAQDDDEKEKVKEIAENLAGDYVFQNARNDLLNKKITELSV